MTKSSKKIRIYCHLLILQKEEKGSENIGMSISLPIPSISEAIKSIKTLTCLAFCQ